jgi:hypothetical protein
MGDHDRLALVSVAGSRFKVTVQYGTVLCTTAKEISGDGFHFLEASLAGVYKHSTYRTATV